MIAASLSSVGRALLEALNAELEGVRTEAGPGSWVFKPRDQWHTFWNAGDSMCHLLGWFRLPGLRTHSENGPVGDDMERMQEIDEKYALDVEYDSVSELCEQFEVTYPEDL